MLVYKVPHIPGKKDKFFFFVVKVNSVCLVCGKALAIMKKANVECHYSLKHAKLDELSRQMHSQLKINAHLFEFECSTSSFHTTTDWQQEYFVCKFCGECINSQEAEISWGLVHSSYRLFCWSFAFCIPMALGEHFKWPFIWERFPSPAVNNIIYSSMVYNWSLPFNNTKLKRNTCNVQHM